MATRSAQPDAPLVVDLGGGLVVRSGAREVPSERLGSPLARRALAALAVEGGAVPRDRIADILWGEDLPRTWDAGLRGVMTKVRRALDAVGAAGRLGTAFGCHHLDGEVVVDLCRAASLVDAAEQALSQGRFRAAAADASSAARVLARPILAGDDSEWVEHQRRRFAAARLRGLVVASEASRSDGAVEDAVRAAREAIGVEPIDERAHRALIGALVDGGDRAAAIQAYRACRDALRTELGVGPSPATEALIADLAHVPPPLPPRRLPEELSDLPPLIGRSAEVAAIHRETRGDGRGPARLVLVRGDAGIGKTRLAAAVADAAHDDGRRVLHGRCPPEGVVAYGGLADALGQLGRPWPPVSPDRVVVVEAALQALADAVSADPVLIVLDDAHWADRPSLAVLSELLAAPYEGPVAVLLTARSDVSNPALEEVVWRRGTTIDVPPLDQAGTRSLADALGVPAGLSPGRLWRTSRGNPLAITQIALAARSGTVGEVLDDDNDLMTIAAIAVRRRTSVLGSGVGLLADAAVLGEPIDADLLGRVTGAEAGRVAAVLDAATRHGLTGEERSGRGRFRFSHELVRHALAETVAPDDRRRLHRMAADVLAGRADRAAQVVDHLLATGDPGDLLRARAFAEDAIAHHRDRAAPESVLALARRMLAADDRAEVLDLGARASLHCHVASALGLLSDAAARPALRDALAAVVRSGDVDLPRLPVAPMTEPPVGVVDHEVVALATRCREMAAPHSVARVHSGALVANELTWSDDPRGAEAAVESVTIARELGDPAALHIALDGWQRAHRFTAAPARRVEVGREMIELARRTGGRVAVRSAWALLVNDLLEMGADEDARQAAGRLREEADAHPSDRYGRWLADATEVAMATLEGRLAEADAMLVETSSVHTEVDVWTRLAVTATQLSTLRYHQGRIGEVTPMLRAVDLTGGSTALAAAVAWALDQAGELPDARDAVEVVSGRIEQLPHDATGRVTVAVLAEAACSVGRIDVATRLAESLSPWSGTHVMAAGMAYLGSVDRYLALVAAARGRRSEAIDRMARALHDHRRVGSLPFVARSAVELATVLSTRGPEGRRRAGLLDEADAIADQVGLGAVKALVAAERTT